MSVWAVWQFDKAGIGLIGAVEVGGVHIVSSYMLSWGWARKMAAWMSATWQRTGTRGKIMMEGSAKEKIHALHLQENSDSFDLPVCKFITPQKTLVKK